MPRCDASSYALSVRVPARIESLVDKKDHHGEEAAALLNLLGSEGCRMDVEESSRSVSGMAAVWQDGRFVFYNFLMNTGEVGDELSLNPNEVVSLIDQGDLTGRKSTNNFYRLVVRDEKYNQMLSGGVPSQPASAAGGPPPKPRKYPGRGLKRMVREALGNGGIPSAFGIKEIESYLSTEKSWKVNVHYSDSSILSAVSDLMSDGVVTLKRDGMVKDRVWEVSQKSVSSALAPAPQTVTGRMNDDEIVERCSDILAERIRKRAMEKLGL